MYRVIVPLDREEQQALIELAEKEKRDPRNQAAFIIRCHLESKGYLSPLTVEPIPPQEAHHDTKN